MFSFTVPLQVDASRIDEAPQSRGGRPATEPKQLLNGQQAEVPLQVLLAEDTHTNQAIVLKALGSAGTRCASWTTASRLWRWRRRSLSTLS